MEKFNFEYWLFDFVPGSAEGGDIGGMHTF